MMRQLLCEWEQGSPTLYTISELARRYNLSLRTLRFYEDKELLRPQRVGLTRYYSERDRTRLELILTGKRLGFSLAEIWELIHSRAPEANSEKADFAKTLSKTEIENQIELLQQRRVALDAGIDELRRAHLRLEATPGLRVTDRECVVQLATLDRSK